MEKITCAHAASRCRLAGTGARIGSSAGYSWGRGYKDTLVIVIIVIITFIIAVPPSPQHLVCCSK